jgi:hypothetical protein
MLKIFVKLQKCCPFVGITEPWDSNNTAYADMSWCVSIADRRHISCHWSVLFKWSVPVRYESRGVTSSDRRSVCRESETCFTSCEQRAGSHIENHAGCRITIVTSSIVGILPVSHIANKAIVAIGICQVLRLVSGVDKIICLLYVVRKVLSSLWTDVGRGAECVTRLWGGRLRNLGSIHGRGNIRVFLFLKTFRPASGWQSVRLKG